MAKERSGSSHWVLIGTALVCILFGSVLIVNGYNNMGKWDGYGSMAETQGTVISSSYDSNNDVHLGYHYNVNGQNYTSDQVLCPNGRYWGEDDAKEAVEKYSPGSNVTVKYDVDDPSTAIVNINAVNPRNASVFNLLMGIMFVVIGLALIALATHPAMRKYL